MSLKHSFTKHRIFYSELMSLEMFYGLLIFKQKTFASCLIHKLHGAVCTSFNMNMQFYHRLFCFSTISLLPRNSSDRLIC